jgi:predicted nucleic acid binding AN1-type Zn finger protein
MNNLMKGTMFADLTITIPPLVFASDDESQKQTDVKSKKNNRCAGCSKKLVLSDFACGKCKIRYCGAHRLPESHSCSHDFRAAGAEQLKTQLTRVIADKIDHI